MRQSLALFAILCMGSCIQNPSRNDQAQAGRLALPGFPQGGTNASNVAGRWAGHGASGFGMAGFMDPVGSAPTAVGPGTAICVWPNTAHCNNDYSLCEPLNTLANCGGCGNRCAIPGARATCRHRRCEMLSCNRNRGDCDFQPFNGCETRLLHDLWNCGQCGLSCAQLPGALSGRCEDGECMVSQCLPGLGDCNEEPQDGCETILNTREHCGRCDNRCGDRLTVADCFQGQCLFRGCAQGAADCRGNGRCVSLSTLEHCGACEVRCAQGQRCQAGVCL